LDLYSAWEADVWEPSEIDLSLDRTRFDAVGQHVRTRFARLLGLAAQPDERYLEPLAAIADSIASPRVQVEAVTQLADIVRWGRFFSRVHAEVCGAQGPPGVGVAEELPRLLR